MKRTMIHDVHGIDVDTGSNFSSRRFNFKRAEAWLKVRGGGTGRIDTFAIDDDGDTTPVERHFYEGGELVNHEPLR